MRAILGILGISSRSIPGPSALARYPMILVGALLVMATLYGCTGEFTSLSDEDSGSSNSGSETDDGDSADQGATRNVGLASETVLVGSYNIQVFGQSKLQNESVMNLLAEIGYRFDVMAIQEIRSANQDVMPRFVDRINARGARFDFVIGPRLGRTVSKEQYAYIYDSDRLEVIGTPFTVPDPKDLLHREPFVARFRVRTSNPQEAFTFALINIHTDPDEVDLEVDVLDNVYKYVQEQLPEEDDFLLLGDLNASPKKFGEMGTIPGLTYVVSNEPTNTRGTKTYDNILFDGRATTEFTGRGGVFRIDREYGLNLEQALLVSDHFPVWSEFSSYESTQRRVAENPRETR